MQPVHGHYTHKSKAQKPVSVTSRMYRERHEVIETQRETERRQRSVSFQDRKCSGRMAKLEGLKYLKLGKGF